ncbi:MAG TPA: hypothetical protein VMU47_20125 [Caldimonas sp.]|nr:hypothetical protein [Caldimonas sp.]
MGPERSTPGTPPLAKLVFGVVMAGACALASAQAKVSGGGIYTCEVNGKRFTWDRPIPECSDRPQKVLNPDGSLRMILPPSMTADERAEAEARERAEMAERVAKQDAIRRDRNLMARFPKPEVHDKARKAALDDVDTSIRLSQARVKLLEAERKKLDDEVEFYPGKPLPSKLKSAIDANEAALAAQRNLIQNQEAERVRINANYDAERQHLEQLWSGVPAGSMGAASGPNSAPMQPPSRPPSKPLVASKGPDAAASKPVAR